jgi:hypothetical protein
VLLVVTGLAFVITATVYVVMVCRDANTRDRPAAEATAALATGDEHPLMQWMRRNGNTALLAELGLLAVCTFAAIGTDSFWQRRAELDRSQANQLNK